MLRPLPRGKASIARLHADQNRAKSLLLKRFCRGFRRGGKKCAKMVDALSAVSLGDRERYHPGGCSCRFARCRDQARASNPPRAGYAPSDAQKGGLAFIGSLTAIEAQYTHRVWIPGSRASRRRVHSALRTNAPASNGSFSVKPVQNGGFTRCAASKVTCRLASAARLHNRRRIGQRSSPQPNPLGRWPL